MKSNDVKAYEDAFYYTVMMVSFRQTGLGKQWRPRSDFLFAIRTDISQTYNYLVNPLCSNFRIITAIFRIAEFIECLQ